MSVTFMIWLIVFVGLPLGSSIATGTETTPAQLLDNLRAMTPAARLRAVATVLYGVGGGFALTVREVARIGAIATAALAVAAGLVLLTIAWRLGLLTGLPIPSPA
ncbi:hypothetical protein ACWCSD_31895 [Nonomuraea sp. NPDC001684]